MFINNNRHDSLERSKFLCECNSHLLLLCPHTSIYILPHFEGLSSCPYMVILYCILVMRYKRRDIRNFVLRGKLRKEGIKPHTIGMLLVLIKPVTEIQGSRREKRNM
jgi:hypothetical protein